LCHLTCSPHLTHCHIIAGTGFMQLLGACAPLSQLDRYVSNIHRASKPGSCNYGPVTSAYGLKLRRLLRTTRHRRHVLDPRVYKDPRSRSSQFLFHKFRFDMLDSSDNTRSTYHHQEYQDTEAQTINFPGKKNAFYNRRS
jgi:hypothetical protein